MKEVMEKRINDKIKALQIGAVSQEEFMKKLAEVDENGQLTKDFQEQINGGDGILDKIIYCGGFQGNVVKGLLS